MILFIEHHLDLLTEKEKNTYNFAALPEFCEYSGIKMINPHYFGNYKIKKNSRYNVSNERYKLINSQIIKRAKLLLE